MNQTVIFASLAFYETTHIGLLGMNQIVMFCQLACFAWTHSGLLGVNQTVMLRQLAFYVMVHNLILLRLVLCTQVVRYMAFLKSGPWWVVWVHV
jgi:hypothetical protein